MYTKEQLLNIALGEIGYLEKKSNSQLDEKTANAGSGNFTRYARDLYAAGYYNGSKQAVAWCNVFVDWCHYMAAGKDKALAQKISCQSGDCGAGCTFSMGYYKAAGQFVTSDPQPGDQIYFGSGQSASHTGLVLKTENGRVYTIEGNTASQSGVVSEGGGVFQKSYALNHSRILGYGRPKWDEKVQTVSVELPVLRLGSTGKQVKTLQLLLEDSGYPCGSWGADGEFGAATDTALKQYQRDQGLTVDGIAGQQTWKSLLGAA